MQPYTPFHRKYRPQVFEDLIGQEVNALILQRMIFSNRIPNALLFCGLRGSGKTSLARIVAKALNCENPKNNNPCNTCNSCNLITSDKHPDVIELDAGSNSSIENIRDLVQNAQYGAKYSKYKIYILDEAHNLSRKAWDVLLKTIEEPAPTTKFIFCTTEPTKIPDTIKSRCQTYIFNNIKKEYIIKRLKDIAQKENIKISDNALDFIGNKVQGSMRDALQLLEQISILEDETKFILQASDLELNAFLDYIKAGDFQNAEKTKNDLKLPDEVFLDNLQSYLCKKIVYDNDIKEKDKLVGALNIVAEWELRLNKTINSSLLSEIFIIKLASIWTTKEINEQMFSGTILESVYKISEKMGGNHKKVGAGHFIITNLKGTQLHVVDNEEKIESGYYCLYPESTQKLINANCPIKNLVGTIIKRKN